MNPLLPLWNDPVVQRLGWTLLHFVWQGALLAAAYAAMRALSRDRPANTRYVAGCLTLLLMAAAPVATFVQLSESAAPQVQSAPAAPYVAPVPVPATSPISLPDWRVPGPGLETFNERLQAVLPWLVVGWVAGVVLLTGRLAVSWLRLRHTRGRCGEALEERLGARVRELQRRLRLSRPVRVMQSALVQVPTLLGWFRPVILLPASTLTGLTPVQLDLILAHELAHLRRWDHWVNLFQVTVETLLFYHPAVWWVSRRVREDREHCCDELAVAVCGNRLAYAQALATLEELRQVPANLALAAADGSLLARIRRILSLPDDERGGGRLSAAGVALMVVGLGMFAAGAFLYATAERRYTATTRILLEMPWVPSAVDPPGQLQRTRLDPPNEMERIRSGSVLEEVVWRLDLGNRWYPGGDATNLLLVGQAVSRLGKQLQLRRVGDSGVIELQVQSSAAQEAADIANAVAEVYRNRRVADFQGYTQRGLAVLESELATQSNRVAALRHQAEDLRARYGLDLPGEGVERAVKHTPSQLRARYGLDLPKDKAESLRARYGLDLTGDGRAGQRDLPEQDMAALIAQQLSQVTEEKIRVSHQLAQLQHLRQQSTSPVVFYQAVLQLLPGEEILPGLLRELNTSNQLLAKLQEDFAAEHPEVRRVRAVSDRIEGQIEQRIRGITLALEAMLKTLDERRNDLLRRQAENQAQMAEKAGQWREYEALRKELEREERAYDALLLRVQQERIHNQMSGFPYVTILETARPIPIPRRTSQPLDIGLMAAGAFVSLSGLALRRAGERQAA